MTHPAQSPPATRIRPASTTASSAATQRAAGSSGFAYVGSYTEHAPGGAAGGPPSKGIHVYALRANGWDVVQVVASANPSYLAVHPSRQFLYAINEIDTWQGLPRGTAEAYAMDPVNGRLTLLNRRALSVSSTAPAHVAVSPDGHYLVTSQYLGGTYNVLPIAADGTLGDVTGIAKETGAGPRPEQEAAHPHMALFDPTGQRILASDLGSDRINLFGLEDGKLVLLGRTALPPGSGPRHLALHPSGHLLFVVNELDASITCLDYDAAVGKVGGARQTVSAMPEGFFGPRSAAALVMHPSGRVLYVSTRRVDNDHPLADGVAVFGIGADGALTPLQFWNAGVNFPRAMTLAPDGSVLYVLNQKADTILQLRIDPASGRLGDPQIVAEGPAPACLVFP